MFARRLLVWPNWIWSDNTWVWTVSAHIALVRWGFQFARTKPIRSHILWLHKASFHIWSDTSCPMSECLVGYVLSDQILFIRLKIMCCPIRLVLYVGCQIFEPSDEIHPIRLCHVSCTVHHPQHHINSSYPTVAFFRNFHNRVSFFLICTISIHRSIYLCVFWA